MNNFFDFDVDFDKFGRICSAEKRQILIMARRNG